MSSGWKDVVKNGWHPEKSGSSLKTQVKGLIGRGDAQTEREEHVPTPRSALRDPASFGPPPKHVAAYGPRAAQGSSLAAGPVASQTQNAVQPYQSQHAQPIEEEPPAEPKPYRFDTTGLNTSHLPPPPTRYNGADRPIPQPPQTHSPSPTVATQAAVTAKPKAPPSLPPRLPPRSGNSSPSPISVIGQAAGQGHLNEGAINRLGAAGISVPGLGIGGGTTPPPPPRARPSPSLTASPTQGPSHGQLDELQTRFARMGASSPSQASSSGSAEERPQQRPVAPVPSVLGKKKPPPPPKPKKPAFSTTESTDAPPPIPLATRPRFS
ncbi:hypothetical protein F4825DRAFT_197055 [Nemania diffusa]|nr:hypothetical protein F4825DRAFT_197055 [Nemania diffusa]